LYFCDKTRIKEKIETFSAYGAAGNGGITRLSLSKEALLAREEFVRRMTAAGAVIETDDVANIYATIPGSEPGLPRIVMGSHCDSVRNGGNYDGILGVIAAMEVIETITSQKIPHRHPITAMIWTNEEGSLYPPAMMCSGIVCGKFDKETMLISRSKEGMTFGEALQSGGYIGEEKNRLNAKNYKAMFELHIEQGPILEEEKKDVGIVACVLGMVNYRIKAYGQSNHAGTTPMHMRKDALYAAAQTLLYLHQELDKLDSALVYTTGEIFCRPCVHTVIPDYVEFSLDARHERPEIIRQVEEVIKNIPKEFSKCTIETTKMWERDTIYFDQHLVSVIQKNADLLGYPNMRINSGAGHDAQFAAGLIPTAMIFVPSEGGRSHCEQEFTSLDQCWMGMNVLLRTILDLASA